MPSTSAPKRPARRPCPFVYPQIDELLAVVRLDLQPVTGALALEVARALPLRHHAFEALRLRGGVERWAVVEEARELHGPLPRVEQRREPFAALLERQLRHGSAVDLEHVEHLVDELRLALALLHGREARAAALVERAHLAVDDALRRADRLLHRLRDRREPLRQVVAVPRDEARDAAAHIARARDSRPTSPRSASRRRSAAPRRASRASACSRCALRAPSRPACA